MDFFARQKEARQKTYLLVPLFAIVVLTVTWAINRLVVLLVLLPLDLVQKTPEPFFTLNAYDIWLRFHPRTTVCALVLIAAGFLWSWWRLRKGATAVAELLGGRRIKPPTVAGEEQRLLNIVEEMALASGISPPAVYVLDDEGSINAFAAGNPEDGVVAVTRGALEKLDRDETQAVVAHEFSHLLNGDSHLNLRLLGLLSGLMSVSAVGTFLKQAAVTRPSSTPRGSSQGNSPLANLLATVALFVAGLLLSIIGFCGVLFGRLIRAAVSRQREFLADAAAVQFTRNPAALVSALRKIAAQPPQWVLENEHREEVSHLLFVPGLRERGRRLFETHPPLADRIRAIDPHLDRTASPAPVRTPEAVVASIGELDGARLDFARQLHGRIPEEVRELARRPEAAPGVIYSVLMAQADEIMEAQARVLAGPGAPGASAKEILFSVSDPVLMPALLQTLPVVQKDRETLRLALVELALPALRALPPERRPGVLDTMRRLIDADRERTLFEYAVYTLVAAALGDRHAANSRVQYERLDLVRPAAEKVLWVLARAGNRGPDEARSAWAAGLQRLGVSPRDPPPADGKEAPAELPQCLAQLRGLAPQLKKRLLGAMAGSALADGRITFGEAEVLRAVSVAVGCPLPLLVAPW